MPYFMKFTCTTVNKRLNEVVTKFKRVGITAFIAFLVAINDVAQVFAKRTNLCIHKSGGQVNKQVMNIPNLCYFHCPQLRKWPSYWFFFTICNLHVGNYLKDRAVSSTIGDINIIINIILVYLKTNRKERLLILYSRERIQSCLNLKQKRLRPLSLECATLISRTIMNIYNGQWR